MLGLADVAAAAPRLAPEPLPVFAHNWPVFELWRDTWRQWRYAGGGLGGAVRVGLDWAQVEAVMHMRRVPARKRGAMLDALRTMEGAALEALAKQQA